MTRKRLAISLAAAGLLLGAAPYAFAEEDTAPIYGQQLMTQEEQEQYRARMRALETEQERAALREQHRKDMQGRARERNVELPDVAAPAGAAKEEPAPKTVRGRELMTEEERERHREEMRSKATAEERERARREKHEEMRERSREQGVELPDQPPPRGSGGGAGGPRQGGRR
jgi:hypothetical protein